MNARQTVKAYYIFICLLPILFYPGIIDMGLLPRQILLSVFVLLLSGFIFKSIKKNETAIQIDSAVLAMLAFLLFSAIFSFVNTSLLSETVYVFSKWWIIISFSIVIIVLLQKQVLQPKQITNSLIIFGSLSVGTALIDLAGKTLQGDYILHAVTIVSGSFGNKNLLSSILFLSLPFFMTGLHQNRRFKTISAVSLGLTLIILVILRARTVLIATSVFYIIIAAFYLKSFLTNKFKLLASVTIVILFSIFVLAVVTLKVQASAEVNKYFSRLLNTRTFQERIQFWKNSIEMFREHPFGVGFGNWQIYFPKYGLSRFDYDIANGLSTLQRPHNDFLGILCEAGIFGFVAFISLFGILIYKAFALIKTAENTFEKGLFTYLFSGLTGFLVIAFFDFPMERIEHLVILFLIGSLIIYYHGIRFKRRLNLSIGRGSLFILLIISAGFSLFISFERLSTEKMMYKLYNAQAQGSSEEVLQLSVDAENMFYKIDTKTIPVEWYKGVVLFSKNNYTESESCFKNAFLLTPYNIHVINNLASCYEINGNRKDAIKLYLKALQISPGFEESRLNLAAVYYNNRDFIQAFNTIDRCSVESTNQKYKIFLTPILKSMAEITVRKFKISCSIKDSVKTQDYTKLYYESKQNNITFEDQIIKHLKK